MKRNKELTNMKKNRYLVKDGRLKISTDMFLGERPKYSGLVVPPRVMTDWLSKSEFKGLPLNIHYLKGDEFVATEVGLIDSVHIGDDFNVVLDVNISNKTTFYEFLFTDDRLVNIEKEPHKHTFSWKGVVNYKDGVIDEIVKIESFELYREVDLKIQVIKRFMDSLPDKLSIAETDLIDKALGEAYNILKPKFFGK